MAIEPAVSAGNGAGAKRSGRASGIILFVLVFGLGGIGLWYYLTTRGTESTDDAYTDGRAVMIAPKIAGYVTKLAVSDNQRVKAGDLLLEVDARDYHVALDKAGAARAMVEAQLQSARANLAIAQANYPAKLAQAQAQRATAEANLARARADFARQRAVDSRATTQQQIDAASATERVAAASLAEADAALKVASLVDDNIAVAAAQVTQLEAQLASASADLDQAGLNLGNTRILAPMDGWVTKRNVELGSYIQIGQSLFSLVSPEIWITANFKESQLHDMRPGQHVEISIDAYPQLKLTGHVDSIQMGSGARFTAFPPENATGNYVKIVQRVPVKLVIDSGLDANLPIPLGLSAEPIVTLK